MAGSSHNLPESTGLQVAIKRIITQHQRDCENTGEFRKAREARAALQELQHQSEIEGLCRLFCRQYVQLSGAEKAYEEHLQMLDTKWRTQQLPELLEKVRRWRQQLQERHEEELAILSSANNHEDCTTLKPHFKKEFFDLQKKVLFLGHQGRYDEAEEVQKLLAVRQRLDAAEQKVLIEARRERQTRRLLAAQVAERHSLESKVDRLVNYHNRQNAEAIDVLRRKYFGQRKGILHNQVLEMQKHLHALKSLTPNEAVRLASSVVNSQWRGEAGAQKSTSSPNKASCLGAANPFPALARASKGKNLRNAALSLSRVTQHERQSIEVLSCEDGTKSPADTHTVSCISETLCGDGAPHHETAKRRRIPPQQQQDASLKRSPALKCCPTGAFKCVPRPTVPLRMSLTTGQLQSLPSTQRRQAWKCRSLDRRITRSNSEHTSQRRQFQYGQDDSKQRSSEQLHTRARLSQARRLPGESARRTNAKETESPAQIDALRDEIFKAWKDCAAKVTKEQANAENLR